MPTIGRFYCIKIQVLSWKRIEGNRRFRVRARVNNFLFFSELTPLTRDLTFSRLYLDGKITRRKYQMKLFCLLATVFCTNLVGYFASLSNVFFSSTHVSSFVKMNHKRLKFFQMEVWLNSVWFVASGSKIGTFSVTFL